MKVFLKGIYSFIKSRNAPWWILHLIVVFAYLYVVIFDTFNIPLRKDDIKFFLNGTVSGFLDHGNDLGDRIMYFFSMGNWPHPKITGRALALVSYYGLGEINYKFFLIAGHLLVITLCWALIRCSELRFSWESLPITLIALTPIKSMLNWSVTILGFVPHILFAFLAYYYISKKSWWLAIAFVILTTFSSGPGFLVVLPAIFIALFQRNRKLILTLTGLFGLAFLAFSILTVDWRFGSGRMSHELSFDHIVRSLNYGLSFLSNAFHDVYRLNGFQLFVIGLLLVLGYLMLFVKDVKNKKIWNHFPLHALIIYIIGISFIAGFIRSNPDQFYQISLPRYGIYSSAFICCLLILIMKQESFGQWLSKVKLMILVLVAIHTSLYFLFQLKRHKLRKDYLVNNTKELFVNKIKIRKKTFSLSGYVRSGLYHPPNDFINPIINFDKAYDLPDPQNQSDASVVFQDFRTINDFTYFKLVSKLRAKSYDIILADSNQYFIAKKSGESSPLQKHDRILIDHQALDFLRGEFRIGILINSKSPRLIMTESVLKF